MCRCNERHATGNGSTVTVNGSESAATSTSCSRTISTFRDEKPKKIIDTADLNVEDIESLKKSDPFLYFSIPAVHEAAVHNKDIDLSNLRDCQSSRVERCSRISFECHTDLLMEEFMEELSGQSDSKDVDAILGSLYLSFGSEQ